MTSKDTEVKDRDLDHEDAQEYDQYVEHERSHRDDDVRTYGEIDDEDFEGDFIEDDPGEFEKG